MKTLSSSKLKRSIDHKALAIHLVDRSPLAASILAIHLGNRKSAVRFTSARTIRDKARRKFGKPMLQSEADSLLHLYSELGLGHTERWLGQLHIFWTRKVDLRLLGSYCDELLKAWRATRQAESLGTGPMVVCMLPTGSLDALIRTGLADLLEIEAMGPPKSEKAACESLSSHQ